MFWRLCSRAPRMTMVSESMRSFYDWRLRTAARFSKMRSMQPLVILNTVGLTSRLLPLAPRLNALAQSQWSRQMTEVLPAVTCTAQASMLTGKLPQEHGIVGNGWLYRDTMEVRFWQQSNRLGQAEPVYATLQREARKRQQPFTCAKLF